AGPAGLSDAVFSPDGTRLAAWSSPGPNRALHVHDAATGREVCVVETQAPFSIWNFSPDGTRILAADTNGKARVYDSRTGQEVYPLKEPVWTVGGAAFSADGSRILAADREGTVRVYDAGTGQEAYALAGPRSLTRALFSPDGTRLATERRLAPGGDTVVA